MSTITNADELCTVDHLKLVLGSVDDDTDADDQLSGVCRSASLEVMASIRPYLSADTRLAETAFHELAVQCSLMYAQSHWYEHNFQLEQSKHYQEKGDKKVKSLIAALKSERPERHQTKMITAYDPLDRVYLPSERGLYITREFV